MVAPAVRPEALVLAARKACSGLHSLGGMNLWIQLAQERSTAPSYELVQTWKAAFQAACPCFDWCHWSPFCRDSARSGSKFSTAIGLFCATCSRSIYSIHIGVVRFRNFPCEIDTNMLSRVFSTVTFWHRRLSALS